MADLIKDTASKLHVEPRVLFVQAAEAKGFTNAEEAGAYRFQRWFKYGEVLPYMTDFCLEHWRPNGVAEHAPQH